LFISASLQAAETLFPSPHPVNSVKGGSVVVVVVVGAVVVVVDVVVVGQQTAPNEPDGFIAPGTTPALVDNEPEIISLYINPSTNSKTQSQFTFT
jgi:hypothetical protein